MQKSSLIGHVCELLDLIRPLRHPADTIVKEFFRARHYLGSKDRRFISETFYAVLRNYRFARLFAETGMRDISVGSIPSDAIYSAFALKIQNESVESVLADSERSWRISFPKNDCRKFLEQVAQATLPDEVVKDSAKRVALTHSFPDSIVREWIERFGEAETEALCKSLNKPAPTTIRINTLQATVEECQRRLNEEGIVAERTTLSPFGLTLSKRMNTQALRSFKDGWFEMQDEGSQLISFLLEAKPGQIVVDACAGGGGKTLHLAALMNNEGELHSIDIDEKRLVNIRPRLERARVTIAQLHHYGRDHKVLERLKGRADAVLVDAPCSGVGTFRRNPLAKLSFDDGFVEHIAGTQRKILDRYASLVKPGGRLVYSTCSLLRKENEEVIESLLHSQPKFRLLSARDVLKRTDVILESASDYLLLLPHRSNTDGFFAAVMQRATKT